MKPNSLDNKRTINRILLFICPAMIIMMLIVALLWGDGSDTVLYLAWSTLLVEILVLYLPARIFINKRGGGKRFGLKNIGRSEWAWAIFLGLGVFFLITAFNGFLSILWEALHIPSIDSTIMLKVGGGWRLFAGIFLVAIVPAYVEETLFRGALLFSWVPQSRTRAIFHSALLFALFHADILSLPALFVMGLILASITLLTDSCYPAMVVHCINNLIAVLLVNLFPDSAVVDSAATATALVPLLLVYAAIGVVISLLCYQGLRRAVSKRQAMDKLLSSGSGDRSPAMEDALQSQQEAAADQTDAQADQGPQPQEKKTRSRYLGTSKLSVVFTYVLLVLFCLVTFASTYILPSIQIPS